jgi:GT2 family glycosyltransferase
MRICRVTAVTSGYDAIKADAELEDGVDRFLFSDDQRHVSRPGWTWRPLPLLSLNPKRRTMFVKSNLPFLLPGYDAYVWSDASIIFTQAIPDLFAASLPEDKDLVTFKHPRNQSLKDEMKEIAREGVLSSRELRRYSNGLSDSERQHKFVSETNVYFARNTDRYRDMCAKWNWRIENAPPRDQLSFDLACSDVGISYVWFEGGATSADSAEFVSRRRHNRPKGASRKVDDALKSFAPDTRELSTNYRQFNSDDRKTAVNDISIVIPVHNAAEELSCLLESIRKSNFEGEVVLVENGSSDNAPQVCRSFEVERGGYLTTVFVADQPLGFSGACNLGAELATGKYLVFLNSDTMLHGKWWEPVLRGFDLSSLAVIGAVGNVAGDCSIGRSKSSQLIEMGVPASLISAACSEFSSKWAANVPFQLTRSVSGHAFAIVKKAFQDVGGFDKEAFPVGYGEEVDLFLRLRRQGWLVGVEPSWYVFHSGRASFGEDHRKDLVRQGRLQLARRYGEENIARLSNDLRNNPFIQTLNYDLDRYLDLVISSLEMNDEQPEDDQF